MSDDVQLVCRIGGMILTGENCVWSIGGMVLTGENRVWSIGGMILTGKRVWSIGGMIQRENRRNRRKTCPNIAVSNINLTWTGHRQNLGLRRE
jgi:hypothetical protein